MEGRGAKTGPGWTRVPLAVVVVHLAAVAVPIVLTPLYAILAGGASAGEFAGLASSWLLPVLTLPAALPNGLLVGGLVAGLLGLPFYRPHDLPSLALFAHRRRRSRGRAARKKRHPIAYPNRSMERSCLRRGRTFRFRLSADARDDGRPRGEKEAGTRWIISEG